MHLELAEVHAGARVAAVDGDIGTVLAVLIDPGRLTLTHLVVTQSDIAGTGRLVPLHHVTSASTDRVALDLRRRQVLRLPRFTVPYELEQARPDDLVGFWLIPPRGVSLALHDSVPKGEVALMGSVVVRSDDGTKLGIVEAWDLDPDTGHLRAIVVRRGHLRGTRHLVLGADLIDRIDATCVHVHTVPNGVAAVAAS